MDGRSLPNYFKAMLAPKAALRGSGGSGSASRGGRGHRERGRRSHRGQKGAEAVTAAPNPALSNANDENDAPNGRSGPLSTDEVLEAMIANAVVVDPTLLMK